MKVLVVGNGGREHALAWKLLQSPQVKQVVCVPGNGGTAVLDRCRNHPLRLDDFSGIEKFTLVHGFNLVVVGPEMPLSLGITDYLKGKNIKVFGPTKAGAQIESSKSWAKALMHEAGIPTARSAVFSDPESAKAFVVSRGAPIVVKADGLASGKGVTVATTVEEAQAAIESLFHSDVKTVVVEEFLAGQELSVLALTDGVTILPLLPAQDHKRIGDGDTGANTGGMGAYAPAPIGTPELMERIQREILQPTIAALKAKGIDYRGVLYAGLMITPQGEPKVLEFNCRFGDPETQAILPLLETPLEDLLVACTQQKLAEMPPIRWKAGACVSVVLASGGYPETFQKGEIISGIEEAEALDVQVFRAGAKIKEEQLVTDGGRVLGVTAVADNFESAIAKAYAACDRIQFEGVYYRRDIGSRVCGSRSTGG